MKINQNVSLPPFLAPRRSIRLLICVICVICGSRAVFSQSKLTPEQRQKLAGAVIRSDKWSIRRELGQEEFTGNVSYKNEGQRFTSDWALWDKSKNTFRTRGNTYATRIFPDGELLEAWSHEGFYNFETEVGSATSRARPIRFKRTSPAGEAMHATSSSATWTGAMETFSLRGDVRLSTPNESGRGEKADYHVPARTLALREGPPIVHFNTEDAHGVLQAEKVDLLPDQGRVEAKGQVHGWVIFEEKPR